MLCEIHRAAGWLGREWREAAGTRHRGSCASGCRCWGGISHEHALYLEGNSKANPTAAASFWRWVCRSFMPHTNGANRNLCGVAVWLHVVGRGGRGVLASAPAERSAAVGVLELGGRFARSAEWAGAEARLINSILKRQSPSFRHNTAWRGPGGRPPGPVSKAGSLAHLGFVPKAALSTLLAGSAERQAVVLRGPCRTGRLARTGGLARSTDGRRCGKFWGRSECAQFSGGAGARPPER